MADMLVQRIEAQEVKPGDLTFATGYRMVYKVTVNDHRCTHRYYDGTFHTYEARDEVIRVDTRYRGSVGAGDMRPKKPKTDEEEDA